MEHIHNDVIDIDDLLGVNPPEHASQAPEEYNFDQFLESALDEVRSQESTKKEKGNPSVKGRSKTDASSRSQENLFDVSDEAFLDSLLSSVGQTVLNSDDSSMDISSEELKRLICEFQEDGILGRPNEARGFDDGVSVCSSASGSLDSSVLGEGVHLKGKQNKKIRGMRLILTNLLRSKSGTMATTSTMRGQDERQKDPRRMKNREKNKRREEKTRQSSVGQSSPSQNRLNRQSSDTSSQVSQSSLSSSVPSVSDPSPRAHSGREEVGVKWEACTAGMTEEAATLFRIALEEDVSALEKYLRSNPSLRDARGHQGNTLLHVLCRQGKLDGIKWLATGLCGHHVNLENNNCFTPTALAVKYGRLDCVEWLIKETKAKNELQSQDNRWSLLHIAARFGQEPCLRWLLGVMQDSCINLDTIDHHGNSPAHLAARHGHLRCLQTLVEFNCDVTMKNSKHQTPCNLATKYNQEACAQFLIVTETCVTLSDQVTQLRRELREYHQEKTLLKTKLDEALSCSRALAEMHPKNVNERIEQIQLQYVDLTNLLVRRIDDMHQQWKKDASNSNTTSADRASLQQFSDEIVDCRKRARELQVSCTQLREEDQALQNSAQDGDIARIQETLHELQNVSDVSAYKGESSKIQEHGEPLQTMRERLNEVHQIYSANHSAINSSQSTGHDDLSLSSSYTSLSSSSSSLSLIWNGPHLPTRPSLRKSVSWEDQSPSTSSPLTSSPLTSSSSLTEHHTTLGKCRGRSEDNPIQSVDRTLNELISGNNLTPHKSTVYNSQQHDRTIFDFDKSLSLHDNQYYSTSKDDYATPTNSSPIDDIALKNGTENFVIDGSNQMYPDGRTQMMPGNNKHDRSDKVAWMKSSLPDVISLGSVSAEIQDSPPNAKQKLDGNVENVAHSWHGGSGDIPKRRPLLSRLRISSSGNNKHLRHSSENSALANLKLQTEHGCMSNKVPVPNVKDTKDPRSVAEAKLEMVLKSPDEGSLRRSHNSQRDSASSSVFGFMRKLAPSGHATQNINGGLNTDGGESLREFASGSFSSDRGRIDLEMEEEGGKFHARLNSDSSLSSNTSSEALWSDGDYVDAQTPTYKRRAGILNRTRKTGDGARKSRNRHITFALDTDGSPNGRSPDSSFRKRDLSPIYESESHRQLREQKDADGCAQQNSFSSKQGGNPSSLGCHEYRVNSYSSDDDYNDDEDYYRTDSPPLPESPEMNGSSEIVGMSPKESFGGSVRAEPFWYESSGDEDEDDEDGETIKGGLTTSMNGSAEKHICYL